MYQKGPVCRFKASGLFVMQQRCYELQTCAILKEFQLSKVLSVLETIIFFTIDSLPTFLKFSWELN